MLATAPTTRTTARPSAKLTVKPIEIVYAVGAKRVTVTPVGGYRCNCANYQLFGETECDHIRAVRTERQKQGRK